MAASSEGSSLRGSSLRKPMGRLQRHVYWLNSLQLRHSLVVNGANDLRDGVVICKLAATLLQDESLCTDKGGIQPLVSVLTKLNLAKGWAPSEGGPVAAASAIFLGDVDVMCDVLGFLEGLAVESPDLLAPQSSASKIQLCDSEPTPQPLPAGVSLHTAHQLQRTERYQSAELTPATGQTDIVSQPLSTSAIEGPIWSALTPIRPGEAETDITQALSAVGVAERMAEVSSIECVGPLSRGDPQAQADRSSHYSFPSTNPEETASIYSSFSLHPHSVEDTAPMTWATDMDSHREVNTSEPNFPSEVTFGTRWSRSHSMGEGSDAGTGDDPLPRHREYSLAGGIDDRLPAMDASRFAATLLHQGAAALPGTTGPVHDYLEEPVVDLHPEALPSQSTPPPVDGTAAASHDEFGVAAEAGQVASSCASVSSWVKSASTGRDASVHGSGAFSANRQQAPSALQALQGLVQRLEIDIDDSVQIGSQSVGTGGLSSSSHNLREVTSTVLGHPISPDDSLEESRPRSGLSTHFNAPPLQHRLAVPTPSELPVDTVVQHKPDSASLRPADDESFSDFIARMAHDFDAGRIPSPKRQSREEEATPESPISSVKFASVDSPPPQPPAFPVAPSPAPSNTSVLDALTRLAEASHEDMETVADSIGSSPRKTPRTSTSLLRKISPERSQSPRLSRSNLSGSTGELRSSRASDVIRRSSPRVSPPRSSTPIRRRDIKAKVDTGAIRRKPAGKEGTPAPSAVVGHKSPASSVSPGGAKRAQAALSAAVHRVRPSSAPRPRWEASVNSKSTAKDQLATKQMYIDHAAQRARGSMSPGVVVPRTRHGVGPSWFKKELGKEGREWLEKIMDQVGVPVPIAQTNATARPTSPGRDASSNKSALRGVGAWKSSIMRITGRGNRRNSDAWWCYVESICAPLC